MRLAKCFLIVGVTGLYVAACLLPGFWGRGGFFEGGTEIKGSYMVLGFPPACCVAWPSFVAMYFSARWLWQDRYRRAFILSCLNILPTAYWLTEFKPGRFELRSGYYVWLAAVVLWAVGVGCLRLVNRRQRPSASKEKTELAEL